jgi:hypothetical protein
MPPFNFLVQVVSPSLVVVAVADVLPLFSVSPRSCAVLGCTHHRKFVLPRKHRGEQVSNEGLVSSAAFRVHDSLTVHSVSPASHLLITLTTATQGA